jgi:hypothetical protein
MLGRKFAIVMVLGVLIFSLGTALAAPSTPPAPLSLSQDMPPVQPIAVDFGVVGGYRYLRVVGQNVPVYDAPRGRVIRRFQGGYDFVTPRSQQGVWVEINPGEWVPQRYLQEVYPSYFTGVVIQAEPAAPWGWILVNQYASNTPGGPEIKEEGFRVRRYNITYFYNALAAPDGLRWYDIGGGRWVRQTYVSKVQRVGNPGVSGRWVAVDLYEQNLVAYDGNTMVFATLVSSGLPGKDTNTGLFNIWAKESNAAMSGQQGGYGNYRLENVPYAMFFDGDISLHGTYWHNGFGYRQSRGCVNLTITDAHWLYEWFGAGGSVYVYYSGSY